MVQKHAAKGKFDDSSLMTDNKFANLLNMITDRARENKDLIHEAAMQSLLYAYVHDDYDRASKLALIVQAELSRGQFTQLVRWFTTFGPFGWGESQWVTKLNFYAKRNDLTIPVVIT